MRRVLGELLAPRLLPLHLVGIVATAAAVALGLWQLDVWRAERESAARDLTDLPAVELTSVLDADDPFPGSAVGRPVEVSGAWLPAATFYVAERRDGDRDGYWAVTPAAVCEEPAGCASSPALLVVRGWTADPASAPPAPEGRVELRGWLQPPEGSGRPDPDPSDDVFPEVRIADAIQRVDQDLFGAFLVLERAEPAAATDDLVPVTPDTMPAPSSDTGLRNLLYGLQWWVFAGFAVFVWWRWVKDEIERSREAEAAAGPPPADAGAEGS